MPKYEPPPFKKGDVILHCGHFTVPVLRAHPSLFFHFMDGPIPFTRPDGTTGVAQWAAVCQSCYELMGEQSLEGINGEVVWQGDDDTTATQH